MSGSELVILDRSGVRQTVTLPGGGVPSRPSWSPDGRWLAFFRLPARSSQYGSSGALWVVRADGTGARRIGNATQFAWDPRQDTLAYLHDGKVASSSVGSARASVAPLRGYGLAGDLSWSASGRDLAVSTVAHRAKGGGIARVV
ncbi:MAG: TolB family protein, partial [Acidimicrobiales bacterium]